MKTYIFKLYFKTTKEFDFDITYTLFDSDLKSGYDALYQHWGQTHIIRIFELVEVGTDNFMSR
jgi:hypothetical protein